MGDSIVTDSKEERARALDGLTTLCEFFQNRVCKGPSDEALREFNKSTKEWVSVTYSELGEKVLSWRKAFAALNLKRGDRVAMLLPNGVNAVCFDQAAMANTLVPVPLHAIDTPASSAYILQDSGASVLVTDKVSKWEKIKEAGFDLSALKKVIITDDEAPSGGMVSALAAWLASASQNADLPDSPTEQDLACIVYTSGTTGTPKGVMLTHKNITSNVRSTLAHVKPEIGDIFLSFLPLSHMFERTAGYYLALATGSTIVFNRSLQYLAEDFRIAKPNVLISVPRVYERIYGKLNKVLLDKGPVAKKVFETAVNAGWRVFCRKNRIRVASSVPPLIDSVTNKLIGGKISRTLKSQFGGRLRVAISGGASLNPEAAKVFCGLGLPVIQGYGMTETSPIISGNNVTDNDPATVGRALKDVGIRLGDKDEIQIKGNLVMRGYWNREKETKEAFTEDGWLHTGDQGRFDEDRRLKIVGRIKEIIVTSTGEKISPVDIESAVETLPLVNQCYAVGDGKPYIGVLVSLDCERWSALASSLHLDPKDQVSLTASSAKSAVLQQVKKACRTFPAYAVPRNVTLTLDEWTIDNGLLTPTLKLKRKPMNEKYGSLIDDMYMGAKKSSHAANNL